MDSYNRSYDNFEEEYEKPGKVKRFFFACAGAYMKILDACPSEHTKYVGIGATIFLTACLAVISGSFAINTLIDNPIISFFFGLLWGALIFNLDRYIVSSIRKEGKIWHELGLAMPRLLLAILISVVITKPIEVELFRNQINSSLLEFTSQLEKGAEEQLDDKLGLDSIRVELFRIDSLRQKYKRQRDGKPTSYDFGEALAEYQVAKSEYDSLNKLYTPRIQANEARRNYLWNKYASKVYETDENGEKKFVRWDFPTKWQEKSTQLYLLNKRLKEDISKKLNALQSLEKQRKGAKKAFTQGVEEELRLLEIERAGLVEMKNEKEIQRKESLPMVLETARKYGIGFPAKIQVLEQMKDEDPSIWWMSNLIVLLFILLETSPVFVKLITKRGPYDYLLNRIEHHKKVESLRYISDMNYDLSANMRLQSRKNGNGTKVNGSHVGEEIVKEK